MIENSFNPVSWKTGKFLIFAVSIQLLMVGLLLIKEAGFAFPVLLPAVGLLYLGFLPGMLLLRILRPANLDSIKTIVFSAGLSLFFSMAIGFFLNFTGLWFGLYRPISLFPLLVVTATILLALSAFIYSREKRNKAPEEIKPPAGPAIKSFPSPVFFLLLLIPVLSILGTALVRAYSNNTVLLIMVILICIIAVLAVFSRIFSPRLFPLALFCMGIAIIYQYTLISPFLTGWDAPLESYFSNLTLTSAYWDYSNPNGYGGMLSVTVLPVTLSYFLNLDIIWVYKAIYPIFYALVPVALYVVFQKQTNAKIAFFAVFFFISLQLFSDTMPSIMRQQIAELFFALLLILMVDWKKGDTSLKILLVAFSAGLIVSHYSTSYIYIFAIVIGWLALSLFKRLRKTESETLLNWRYAGFLVAGAVSWYIFTASGANFESLVSLGYQTYLDINNFLAFGARESSILKAVGLAGSDSFFRGITTNLYRVTQLFIVLGVFLILFIDKKQAFRRGFLMASLAMLIIIAGSVALPYFSEYLHIDRIYHLTLFFLAPFCIIGGQAVFNWIIGIFNSLRIKTAGLFRREKITAHPGLEGRAGILVLAVLVLIPYFLSNIGFTYEVAGEPTPTSLSLSFERYRQSDDAPVAVHFHSNYIYRSEVLSARWLSRLAPGSPLVYCDRTSLWSILPAYASIYPTLVITPDSTIHEGSYVYLNRLNVDKQIVYTNAPGERLEPEARPISEFGQFADFRIYSNGHSEIYYNP